MADPAPSVRTAPRGSFSTPGGGKRVEEDADDDAETPAEPDTAEPGPSPEGDDPMTGPSPSG